MVLESLITAKAAESHPKQMLVFGALFSIIAAMISFWVFNQYASIVTVFLITIAASPLIYKIIRYEEKKDTENYSQKNLLKEHEKALKAFMYLFLGVTITLSVINLILPLDQANILFQAQHETITQINGKVNAELTGNFANSTIAFKNIFFNNVRVLIFCIMFSFLYGIGALFILNWNASVIAVAFSSFIKEQILIRSAQGVVTFTGYVGSVGSAILRYSIHGIPEILAYIVAGLAGGIISVAIIRYDFRTKNFQKIIMDTSNLLIISFAILIMAAILEVYVTPLFFI